MDEKKADNNEPWDSWDFGMFDTSRDKPVNCPDYETLNSKDQMRKILKETRAKVLFVTTINFSPSVSSIFKQHTKYNFCYFFILAPIKPNILVFGVGREKFTTYKKCLCIINGRTRKFI